MKRQEMINKLVEYFCSKIRATPAIMADEILALVEKEGMFPPLESGRTVHDLDLGVPVWETEDEAK